ncbi:hypothetical protein Mal4_23040 [Maioricimonas rarisocia]|uniref:Carboxypeptidase regulatory-like domain-containing protein n=1 Tax=Maioricimonas rarisocia TaxID=2528026 RepID=A0A517Z692_9PLAN|nr:carboxypeptidase-like regulatory domain-containing protein [Maioricimonas rarisocia]QDU37985.1 hypothetical protein Mal4_23040 [Maioricimonas rarisocia]
MRCFCLVLALMVTGCSSSPDDAPELVEYTGVVTLDGQPLGDAVVMFHPTQPGLNGAAGQTNADGEFSLVTGNRSGVTPGNYKVTVSRIVTKDGSPVSTDEGMDIEQLRMSGDASESIPDKYSALEQTQLTADITDSPETPPSFELTSS